MLACNSSEGKERLVGQPFGHLRILEWRITSWRIVRPKLCLMGHGHPFFLLGPYFKPNYMLAILTKSSTQLGEEK